MISDDTIISLKIVGMIKEGQKVSIKNGYLKIEQNSHGLITSIKRWINNDNRYNTLGYIQNLINNALDSEDTMYHPHLTKCLPGLNALAVTYREDTRVTATIRFMEEKIKSQITNG